MLEVLGCQNLRIQVNKLPITYYLQIVYSIIIIIIIIIIITTITSKCMYVRMYVNDR